jgi:hypothetical protein
VRLQDLTAACGGGEEPEERHEHGRDEEDVEGRQLHPSHDLHALGQRTAGLLGLQLRKGLRKADDWGKGVRRSALKL